MAGHSWKLSIKKLVSYRADIFGLILCCVFLFNSNANPQTIKGSYSYDRPAGQIETMLIKLADTSSIKDVPKDFFGENNVYDAELADLLVFIDKTGQYAKETKFALLKKGKLKEELFGDKFIYIMVFVAENENEQNSMGQFTRDIETTEKTVENLGRNTSEKADHKAVDSLDKEGSGQSFKKTREKEIADATGKTREVVETIKYREPLSISQSSLESRPGSGEFILTSVLRTIANIFSGMSIEKAEKAERAADIVNIPLRMYLVGSDKSGKIKLYFGLLKTPISENTINRFTVQEEYGNNDDPHQNRKKMYLATFGNFSGSYVTSSIGLMTTIVKSEIIKTESGVTKSSRTPLDPFLFAHVYLQRPKLPRPRYQQNSHQAFYKKLSFSIVAGTKISTSLFDDLFLGASVGHFYSTVGIVAGINFRTVTILVDKDQIRKKRKLCFSLGLTLML